MKTQTTLNLALNKFKTELNAVRDRIDWVNAWLDSANFMQAPDLFIAQRKEKDDLKDREKELDFKIRFVEWVLETEKPKEENNGKENPERSM